LQVVAEGVETAAQAVALCAFGCTLVQGYYYARPMAAEAVGTLLARGRAPYSPLPGATTRPQACPDTAELRRRRLARHMRLPPSPAAAGAETVARVSSRYYLTLAAAGVTPEHAVTLTVTYHTLIDRRAER